MGRSHWQHSTWHPRLQRGLATTPSPGPDLRPLVHFQKERLQNQVMMATAASLWINMGSEINPYLGSCPPLGRTGAQMNKKKSFCGGNNVFSLHFPLLCHFFLISHIYYYCMKIHMPIPWKNTLSSQPVLLSYPHQCCYSSALWSCFKINYIYLKKFQNCKKSKILYEARRDVYPKFSQNDKIWTRGEPFAM